MYGPDVTFLGVPRVSLDALREMDIVFLGAPFDSGTSHRPGAVRTAGHPDAPLLEGR